MDKHTKGPWGLHPSYGAGEVKRVAPKPSDEFFPAFNALEINIASGEKLIGSVLMYSPVIEGGWPRVENEEECRANANLIFAAPDLLEVARLGVQMREAQARYFKNRSQENLKASIQLERDYDYAVKKAIAKVDSA